MSPTQQRFKTRRRARRGVHLRLEHQKKLTRREAAPNIVLKLRPMRLLSTRTTREMLNTVAA